MPKLFWEDFVEGSVAEYGPRLVTREEIVAFAAEFDPQAMHLDEDAARSTLLGGLAASGWHTCVLLNRLVVDGLINNAHSMGAPGVDEVQWLKPVRPGDRLVVVVSVLLGLAGMISSLGTMAINPIAGLLMLIASFVGMLAGIVFARIAAELVLIAFRINEHLGAMRNRGGM